VWRGVSYFKGESCQTLFQKRMLSSLTFTERMKLYFFLYFSVLFFPSGFRWINENPLLEETPTPQKQFHIFIFQLKSRATTKFTDLPTISLLPGENCAWMISLHLVSNILYCSVHQSLPISAYNPEAVYSLLSSLQRTMNIYITFLFYNLAIQSVS